MERAERLLLWLSAFLGERPDAPTELSGRGCSSRNCICWDEVTWHLTRTAIPSAVPRWVFVCVSAILEVWLLWRQCGRNKKQGEEVKWKRAAKKENMKSLRGGVWRTRTIFQRRAFEDFGTRETQHLNNESLYETAPSRFVCALLIRSYEMTVCDIWTHRGKQADAGILLWLWLTC